MSGIRKSQVPKCRRLELTDDELLGLLEDLRAGVHLDETIDAESIESAIAELEIEASCRGLNVPATCQEPTPQPLALRLLWAALTRHDLQAAARAMTHLDAGALWFAYRRIRGGCNPQTRLFYFEHVLFCLESQMFRDQKRARERRAWLATSGLSGEDRLAYLNQCIDTMFGQLLAYGSPEFPAVE